MLLTYETRENGIVTEKKKSMHVPPHLHEAIEMVYVTEGTVELGVAQELYHMETGDFAIVFPNVIHHYQVFGSGKNCGIYVFVEPTLFPSYVEELQQYCPKYPIIEGKSLHSDVKNALQMLAGKQEKGALLCQAYVQVILAHVFSTMQMMRKESVGMDDIIYKAVEYVAKNFRDEISLEKMAKELGINKYALSRMFSKTFHCNFSKYVNGVRLNYAISMLENSQESITNLCLECGFESQRTFNRVFKAHYKMTPREYRNYIKQKVFIEEYIDK